jgi:hypothetical protein
MPSGPHHRRCTLLDLRTNTEALVVVGERHTDLSFVGLNFLDDA